LCAKQALHIFGKNIAGQGVQRNTPESRFRKKQNKAAKVCAELMKIRRFLPR